MASAGAKKCKGGTGAVKIGKRQVCSKAGVPEAVGPGGDPTRTALQKIALGEKWLRSLKRLRPESALDQTRRINRKLPARILRGQAALKAALDGAAASKTPAWPAARPFVRARAVNLPGGPKGTTGSFDPTTGRLTASGSYDAGNGVTIDATLTGTVKPTQASNSDEMDIEIDKTEKKGGVKIGRFGIGFKTSGTVDQCPSAAGVVNGDLKFEGRVTTQVGEGDLLQIIAASEIKAKGQTNEDAELETIDVAETQETVYSADSFAAVVKVRSTARIDAKSGTATPTGPTTAEAKLAIRKKAIFSFLERDHEEIEAMERDFAKSWLDETGDQLSDASRSIVLEKFRKAEKNWRIENQCAKAKVEPVPPKAVRKGDRGTISASVSAADGGSPAGRWTATPTKLTLDPASGSSTAGSKLDFGYTVGEVQEKDEVGAEFRVTSKGGIATASWKTKAENEAVYIDVEVLGFAAGYEAAVSDPCPIEGDSEEKAGLDPPFSGGEDDRFHDSGGGTKTILLVSNTEIHRVSDFTGCKILEKGFPPCGLGPIDFNYPFLLGAMVDLPESGDAELTWYVPPAGIGPTTPNPSCFTSYGFIEEQIPTGESTAPRSYFLDGAAHLISHTRQVSIPQFNMTGEAALGLTIRRVNADGSPYTGAK